MPPSAVMACACARTGERWAHWCIRRIDGLHWSTVLRRHECTQVCSECTLSPLQTCASGITCVHVCASANVYLRTGCDLSYVMCGEEAATPIKCYGPELMVSPVYSTATFDRIEVCTSHAHMRTFVPTHACHCIMFSWVWRREHAVCNIRLGGRQI